MVKCLVLTLGLCLIVPPAVSQEAKPPLSLVVQSDKKIYELGEKITLTYALENTGNAELPINRNIVPGGNMVLSLENERTGIILRGPTAMFLAATWQQRGVEGIVSLPPGERIVGTFNLDPLEFVGWKDAPAETVAGKYWVRAHLKVHSKAKGRDLQQVIADILSNPVTIEIKAK